MSEKDVIPQYTWRACYKTCEKGHVYNEKEAKKCPVCNSGEYSEAFRESIKAIKEKWKK